MGGRGSLGGGLDNGVNANHTPGFFPAITHFTDAITALPKEMIRHYTMLKEVDAKVFGPEDALNQLVSAALQGPDPPQWKSTTNPSVEIGSQNTTSEGAAASFTSTNTNGVQSQGEATLHAEAQDSHDLPRRQLFLQLRTIMAEMLLTLDEKNHVMSTATDALDKQLERCDSSFPHIEDEISEEARYGNLNHWAYVEKAVEKKGTTAGERTRREAALQTQLQREAEQVPMINTEARITTRRQQKQHDSDFDEGRGALHGITKKTTGPGKGRKAIEATPLANGIPSGYEQVGSVVNGTNKRRKVEKATMVDGPAAFPPAMSTVYGRARGGGSPRETPAAETRKGKARGGGTMNGTGRRR